MKLVSGGSVVQLGITVAATLAMATLLLSPQSIGVALGQDGAKPPKGLSFLTPRGTRLLIPAMDAKRGRRLFAKKGCVVCHAVNGVGGSAGPRLDAGKGSRQVSVFDFASRMWNGAEAMISLQKKDIGYQVHLRADEMADLTAFVHDRREQAKFKDADIPPAVRRWMHELRL